MFLFTSIYLILFSLPCTGATESSPHITVNVNTTNNNNLQGTNTNQNSNTALLETIRIESSKAAERFKQFLLTDGQTYYEQTRTGLWEYRYYIYAATLLSIYSALWYQLYCGLRFTQQTTLWAAWHSELTLKELLAYDIEAVTQELLIAIQVKYSNDNNPTDFILPLVTFSAAIQKELETLQYYATIYRWCKSSYLIKIIPIGTRRLELLNEYIERTTYIQTLFKNWAAHHNIACQAQCPPPQSIGQRLRNFLRI